MDIQATKLQRTVVVCVLLPFVVAGCGGGPDKAGAADAAGFHISDAEESEGRALQQELLADGVADKADYEQAVEAAGLCMAKREIELVNDGWDPVSQQEMMIGYRNIAKPDNEVSGYGEACTAAYLDEVRLQFTIDNPAVMAPDLMAASQACLKENNVGTAGDEVNLEELLVAVGPDDRSQVSACITSEARELYPGIPIFVGW